MVSLVKTAKAPWVFPVEGHLAKRVIRKDASWQHSSAPSNHITHFVLFIMSFNGFYFENSVQIVIFREKDKDFSFMSSEETECGGNSCISTCPNMRPETRSRPWMRSGLRIAGIVYDCNCWQSRRLCDCRIHAASPFLLLVMGTRAAMGWCWRRLQEVTWGYPNKTLPARFVPVVRQLSICQLFVNLSFGAFLVS